MRTIQKYKKNLGVLTARRSGLSKTQKAGAIDQLEEDDPLERWGSRLVKEKLGHKGLHIPRYRFFHFDSLSIINPNEPQR